MRNVRPFLLASAKLIARLLAAIWRKRWAVATVLVLWGLHSYWECRGWTDNYGAAVLLVPARGAISGTWQDDSQAAFERRRNQAVRIFLSNRVMSNAVDTLSDLGCQYAPHELLGQTFISGLDDSEVTYAYVRLPPPSDVMCADVVASCALRAFHDFADGAGPDRELAQKQVAAASRALAAASAALGAFRREHAGGSTIGPADKIALAILQADHEVAVRTYAVMRSELEDAALREQRERATPQFLRLGTIAPVRYGALSWRIWAAREAGKGLGYGVVVALSLHLIGFGLFEPRPRAQAGCKDHQPSSPPSLPRPEDV